jgi:hypothetical protein
MSTKEGLRLVLASFAILAASGPRTVASAARPDADSRSRLYQFAVSPDGSTLWLPSPRRTLREIDAWTGQTLRRVRLGFPISGVARNPEGTLLACFSSTQGLCTFITLDLLRAGVTAGTAPGPAGADFDPGSSSLCVLSPRSLQLEGLDPSSGQRLFVVPLDTTPFAFIHAGGSTVVSLPQSGSLLTLDEEHRPAAQAAVLPGVESLAALAFPGETYYDPTRTMFYLTSRVMNSIAAVDADTLESQATVSLDSPWAVVAAGARVSFLHGTDRTLVTVFDGDPTSPAFLTPTAQATLPEPIEAMAVASAAGYVFAVSDRGRVYRIDPVSGQVTEIPLKGHHDTSGT